MTSVALPAARLGRVRSGDTAAAAGTAVILVVLLAENGGFFPTSWGWATLVLLWAAALGLLATDVLPGPAALAMTGALAAVAAWTAASATWSTSVTRSTVETQRVLVYPAALAALFVLGRGRQRSVVAGALAAVALVSAYALATRLFPERLGVYDPVATYRLSAPVGYWNALGLVAAMGALLALGYAAAADRAPARAVAAAMLPVLVCTLYFTFSRGAWVALAAGLASAVVLDPRRIRYAVTALALFPWTLAGVLLAAHSPALTTQGARLAAASHDGHRLAAALVVLCSASALAAWVVAPWGARARVGRRAATVLAAAVAVAAVAALAHDARRPDQLARDTYARFTAAPPPAQPDLNTRLFTVSSGYRNLHWRVAWREFLDHPLLGSGAGTYEQFWLEHRTIYKNVEDAHSLYVETLAELGPFGLVVLLAGLAVPVWAAVRRRRAPFVPAAAAAYGAYLVHAGVDWDWELTGVTLLALALGGAVVLEADRAGRLLASTPRALAVGALVVLGLAGLAGTLGQRALADAVSAADAGQAARAAARAGDAHRWAPWSSQPWEALGAAEEAAGQRAAARRSYRRAAALDPREWQLWVDVARVSSGRARARALARAGSLNPLSLEIAELRGAS